MGRLSKKSRIEQLRSSKEIKIFKSTIRKLKKFEKGFGTSEIGKQMREEKLFALNKFKTLRKKFDIRNLRKFSEKDLIKLKKDLFNILGDAKNYKTIKHGSSLLFMKQLEIMNEKVDLAIGPSYEELLKYQQAKDDGDEVAKDYWGGIIKEKSLKRWSIKKKIKEQAILIDELTQYSRSTYNVMKSTLSLEENPFLINQSRKYTLSPKNVSTKKYWDVRKKAFANMLVRGDIKLKDDFVFFKQSKEIFGNLAKNLQMDERLLDLAIASKKAYIRSPYKNLKAKKEIKRFIKATHRHLLDITSLKKRNKAKWMQLVRKSRKNLKGWY